MQVDGGLVDMGIDNMNLFAIYALADTEFLRFGDFKKWVENKVLSDEGEVFLELISAQNYLDVEECIRAEFSLKGLMVGAKYFELYIGVLLLKLKSNRASLEEFKVRLHGFFDMYQLDEYDYLLSLSFEELTEEIRRTEKLNTLVCFAEKNLDLLGVDCRCK